MALVVSTLVVLAVVATDVWVFFDAQGWEHAGTPVEFRLGTFSVHTPTAWFVACLVVWIFFFPIYLVARRS